MSNIIEYNDKIAFHPGYYIKELVEESGLTQKDFANRLDTTPKNLSELIKGEQNLSIDIAMKLSRMIGTSVDYWLNLQGSYDALIAEFRSNRELEKERLVFKNIDYNYFKVNFGLPDLPKKIDEQIKNVREFLNVSTLSVLAKKDFAVSFRCSSDKLTEANRIKSNIMVQIAINEALKKQAPKYNKSTFEKAINYALKLTNNHNNFYPLIYKEFLKAGVIFVILPNLSGSKINGATKKIGSSVLLMVNDRRTFADTFWFTLFHEIGHIINGDFGVTIDDKCNNKEDIADKYAENILISPEKYSSFLKKNRFDKESIVIFAKEIDRNPGIVLGRLQNEGKVKYNDWRLQSLKQKYKIILN